MDLTIDLTDEAQLQLTETDVTVQGNTIQFTVQGQIEEIPDEVIQDFAGDSLLPTEIVFEQS
jgi:hypothetical protein